MPTRPLLNALPRRAILQAGTLGLAGLSWANLLRARAGSHAAGADGFGRAKQCILLFMWGGPSHIDTFDPKPQAPKQVRGPFATISTNVPGIEVSEHYHRMARHADKLAIVRSMTHDDPAHLSSVHTLLTGHLPPVNKSDAEPPSDRDTPHIGSVMSKLRPAAGAMPSFVAMPWIVSHPSAPGGKAPGQHGGWLGHQHDPFLVAGDPNQPNWQVPALALIDGQSPDRLNHRRDLLSSLDRQRRVLESGGIIEQLSLQQSQAFGLLTSATVRGAFDVQQETAETRDRYGRHIHGQCVLLARRLIDHGVPLVAVNWHDDGRSFWDTHGNNFNRLKNDLIPPNDRAFAALLDDLSASGKLDETLIVWVGEFGRGPHINGSSGREHHPGCYTGVLAGGGVRGGQIYGASDAIGMAPAENPVSPHDVTATMFHALGIPNDAVLRDALNRPHAIYGGTPLTALF
ncbi:MAG TPA: DUF1501 domain-containing protein [Planctomycetaceae bacterium]|nr:DUF1501 domain-containing protein [Planctomycetaceae bacterium]